MLKDIWRLSPLVVAGLVPATPIILPPMSFKATEIHITPQRICSAVGRNSQAYCAAGWRITLR